MRIGSHRTYGILRPAGSSKMGTVKQTKFDQGATSVARAKS